MFSKLFQEKVWGLFLFKLWTIEYFREAFEILFITIMYDRISGTN